MKQKPDLSFWKLWNLSFGFFGVQIAYALQSANVSRIFATLGADPHDLSYFWILPPLMGLIVQPIVGSASDKTWTRLGRRLPYLIVGALIAVAVMCLLPNAGSFGLTVSSAILIGLFALMLLDTSINMAMQPFKMLVGDMVNQRQKGLAYSIQSFLCNAGSIVGFVFPFLLTWLGFENTAAEGVIPPTVVYSFYIGAAILLLCVLYSLIKIKEWPPHVYAEYNGGPDTESDSAPKKSMWRLLVEAPRTFWTVSLVQFFCWFAFLFMWTYTNGTVAKNAFDTPATLTINGINEIVDGHVAATYNAKYVLLPDSTLILAHGKATVAGITLPDGRFIPGTSVTEVSRNVPEFHITGPVSITAPALGIPLSRTLASDGFIASTNGVADYSFATPIPLEPNPEILVDGKPVALDGAKSITLVDHLSRLSGNVPLQLVGIYTHEPSTGALFLDEVSHVTLRDASRATYKTSIVLNTESPQYNDAGNWVGILFAIQAIGSVIWAVILPMFRSRKFSYSLSLLLGAVGFITAGMFTNPYMLFISFVLIGCAWAAMLAWPFTILTNSLRGGNIGTYLGLFNCSICVPQIVGALAGGWILTLLGNPAELAPQATMMIVAGISLIIGACCVTIIKED